MRVNFVFYILYLVSNILYLMRTCHTWTYFFSSFIISKSKYLSPWKEIVDCRKESTARKTHLKQPHFYPINSNQIQKLSIQQHNILDFLKKTFDKDLLHFNKQNRFCLSFHLSITFSHNSFHSWKPHPLQQGDLLSLWWYSPLKDSLE